MRWSIKHSDALAWLKTLPDESVHSCVTSPPYYRLRDYGHPDQLGWEEHPRQFVARLVEIFREVRRVLVPTGSLWLNLGDSYCGAAGGQQGRSGARANRTERKIPKKLIEGFQPKDLLGVPWRVAFGLQDDGWRLRSDIIWHKPNPIPSPVQDRPTSAHEYVFFFVKSQFYHFDRIAIREPTATPKGTKSYNKKRIRANEMAGKVTDIGSHFPYENETEQRNARTVWTIPTQPNEDKHEAPMPLKLAERCVLAGTPPDGLVIDPFTGRGTVGIAALRQGRRFAGSELVEKSFLKARCNLAGVAPLLDQEST